MGKKAQADARRAEKMGLHKVGLETRDVKRMNEVALAMFRMGIGVLVQEEERCRRIAASHRQERDGTPRWRQARRWMLWRLARRADGETLVWAERIMQVTDEVARLVSDKELARSRRAR